VKHPSGDPLWGRLLASPTNIRLHWKGLLGAFQYYKTRMDVLIRDKRTSLQIYRIDHKRKFLIAIINFDRTFHSR